MCLRALLSGWNDALEELVYGFLEIVLLSVLPRLLAMVGIPIVMVSMVASLPFPLTRWSRLRRYWYPGNMLSWLAGGAGSSAGSSAGTPPALTASGTICEG